VVKDWLTGFEQIERRDDEGEGRMVLYEIEIHGSSPLMWLK
jgi:hypothetical protein